MPRQWRCANNHTWTGELGALTFCPDCGSSDVYEVRPEYHSLATPVAAPTSNSAIKQPTSDETFVQPARPATADDTFVQPVAPAAAKIADTLIQPALKATQIGDTVVQQAVAETLVQRFGASEPGTTEEQAYLRKEQGDSIRASNEQTGSDTTFVQAPATGVDATLVQAPSVTDASTLDIPAIASNSGTMIQMTSGQSSDQSSRPTVSPPAGTVETRIFKPGSSGGSRTAFDPAVTPTLDGTGLDAPAFRTAEYAPTVSVHKPGASQQAGLSQADTRLAPPAKPREAKPGGPPPVEGYEILGTLGRGGMGVVYKARQIKLNRVVALKMILAGGHAGAYERQRFVTEMHAVAALTHPNIVQIFETGERDGLPFFSLEFCDGGSLQQRLGGKPLPPKGAAEIVVQLAHAMQYAHERGIVHRDLKPANILFTGGEDPAASKDRPTPTKDSRPTAKDSKASAESLKTMTQSKTGQTKSFSSSATTRTSVSSPTMRSSRSMPKVTDFGLAKRLEEESGLTGSGTILGTPSYMAPEQAAGRTKSVGPAADIHALGAILYEMLTGRPPFLGESAVETMNQVRTLDPVPPSRIQPKTPRDLEIICLKCLQKEIHKRYATAGDLADDLHRFLDHRPITARPVPFWEKGWKWAMRRPAQAGLIGVCLAGLVAAAVGGMMFGRYQSRQAAVQKDLKDAALEAYQQAEANFKAAREAVNSLLVKVGSERLQYVPQAEKLRRELLEEALAFYDRFLKAHGNDPNVRREAGGAYQRVGQVRSYLGDRSEAIAAYKSAVGLFEALAKDGNDTDDQLELAATNRELAVLYEADGHTDEADAAFEAAKTELTKLIEAHPDQPAFRFQLADLLTNRGMQFVRRRKLADAEQSFRQAFSEYDRLLAIQPVVKNAISRTRAQANYGDVLLTVGRPDNAAVELRKAALRAYELAGNYPDNTDFAKEFGQTAFALGDALMLLKRYPEAEAAYRLSVDQLQKLASQYPKIPEYRYLLALAHDNVAHFLKTSQQGPRAAELGVIAAEPEGKISRGLYEQLLRESPINPDYKLRYAIDLDEHALFLVQTGRVKEALDEDKTSMDLLAGLIAADPLNPELARVRANVELNLGQLLYQNKQTEDALTQLTLAAESFERLASRKLNGDESWYPLAEVYLNQALIYQSLGRDKAVDRYVRQSVAVRERIVTAHPDRVGQLEKLAHALAILSDLPTVKPEESLPLLKEALRRQRAVMALAPKPEPYVENAGQYGNRLVERLVDQGQHAAAAAAAADLSRDVPPSWRGWSIVAGQLARCVRLARNDNTLSAEQKAKLSAEYGEQALDLLKRAVAAGYNDASALKDSPELEVLRTDPAFKPAFDKILVDIAARNKK
jgi:serine/threonine protein kinase/tetratricopeptide (TPR) repeat protein